MEKLNEPKFEAYYREQMPRVYNFFRYRFADEMLAEDLTSQTFEKAWKHRSRYRNRLGAFSTWIFTIAHRIAIDTYRRNHRDFPIDDIEEKLSIEHVEQESDLHEQLKQMGNLLKGLSETEHEMISLKYGAGLNNRQIAKITRVTPTNVGVVLHRTVKKLREKWEKMNE